MIERVIPEGEQKLSFAFWRFFPRPYNTRGNLVYLATIPEDPRY